MYMEANSEKNSVRIGNLTLLRYVFHKFMIPVLTGTPLDSAMALSMIFDDFGHLDFE